MAKFKKGDIVWVNEATLSQRPRTHEWYGQIVAVRDDSCVSVKDMTPDSPYYGQAFDRFVNALEIKTYNPV